MKKITILILLLLFVISCSKDETKTDTNNTTGGATNTIKYPYFTVGSETYGGIALLDTSKKFGTLSHFYSTTNGPGPFGPCAGQMNYNTHFEKYHEISITDTTKVNTTAKIFLQSGSQSDIFKLKGNYQITKDNTTVVNHGSCPDLNTCGKPNDRYYEHETTIFLDGYITINNYNYKIINGTYSTTNYATPLKSTFVGKAIKSKSKNEYDYDTTFLFDVKAKFY
jgi:hypothetical protein